MARFWGRGQNQESRLEHVEAMIGWMVGIGLGSVAAMLLFGLGTVPLTAFGGFFLWAMFGALASLLAGGGLGLLFGLPTIRRVEVTTVPAETADSDAESQLQPSRPATSGSDDVQLGYAESTNLEHVADWLTKIIVGLTLTQFGAWEERFARLSYDLGYRLLGGPACDEACGRGIFPAGSTIPGGAIIVFYALLGFLIGYLWMRGYFITEMEGAKRNAKDKALRKRAAERRAEQRAEAAEIARADADQARVKAEADKTAAENATKLAQEAQAKAEADRAAADEARRAAEAAKAAFEAERAVEQEARLKAAAEAEAEQARARAQGTLQERGTIAFTSEQATEMAAMVSFTAEEAQTAVSEIREAIAQGTNPDDPWRGQFGGSPEQNGLRLSATATQTVADPHYYDVLLRIEGTDAIHVGAIAGKSARVFLHPTFGTEPRTVYFGADGIAQLQLLAYGAFTVGVLVEDGTKLELNLATIEGVDPGFLSR